MQNILGGTPLLPSQIAPSRRGDLWRTYLNAASNVDAAVGRVIDVVHRTLHVRPAVVIISDHGESLFDHGFVGHGYALDEAQTRVPFIVSGLPVRITTPFGQSQLRDALSDALSGKEPIDAPPMVEPGTSGRVFQYLGPLDTPGQIGWLTSEGGFTFDFRTNLVHLWDTNVRADQLKGAPQNSFEELVHTWESLQLALARQHGMGGAAP
jgi:hypothetical protein